MSNHMLNTSNRYFYNYCDYNESNEILYTNNENDPTIVLNYISNNIYNKNKIYLIIQKFINKGGNIDDILNTSCRLDCFEVAKVMIKYGANVNSNNNDALMWSILNKTYDITKLLIENGSNVNACNGLALLWVIQNNNIDMVKYFIENGANINLQHNTYLETIIINNQLSILKYLIENGANINLINETLQQKVKQLLVSKWEKAPENIKFRNNTQCPISYVKLNQDSSKNIEKLGCSKCLNVFEKEAVETWFEHNTICPMKCGNNKFYLLEN
jgi:ankyrin repeat protein